MTVIYDDEPFKRVGAGHPDLNKHLKELADKADAEAFMDRVAARTVDIFNAAILGQHQRHMEANPVVETAPLTDEELDAMDAETAAQYGAYETPKWFQDIAPIEEPITRTVEAAVGELTTEQGVDYLVKHNFVSTPDLVANENSNIGGIILPSYTLPPAPTFYPNSIPYQTTPNSIPYTTTPIITPTPAVPETKVSNPKDAVGVKKIAFSTVPSTVIAEVAVGMTEGARKYGRHNYRAVGVRYSVYYDATLRHLMKWWEGEDIDPDSGLSHVTKAITSLVVLRDAMINGKVTDDRPPSIPDDFWNEIQAAVDEVFAKYPDSVEPFLEANRR